jgi:hypothetical protein
VNVSSSLQKTLRADLAAEPECIKEVFALVRDRLRQHTLPDDVSSRMEALPFFWWAKQEPSLEQVRMAVAPGQNTPGTTPRQIKPGDPILIALDGILELAEDFSISRGSDVCRLLGFVCQTLSGSDHERRKGNDDIAGKFYSAARQRQQIAVERKQFALRQYQLNGGRPPQSLASLGNPKEMKGVARVPVLEPRATVVRPTPWPNLSDRQDETTGGFVTATGISLWYAAHVGPRYAQKGENQDAAHALGRGSRVFFALADGVSTSFGSRFAAAAIVKLFCEDLANRSKGDSPIDEEALKDTARRTHEWLNACLEYLTSNQALPEWSDLKGASNLNMDVVLQLAENTTKPKNRFWAPVMASTLVGGYAERTHSGATVTLIRIGDGIAERTDRDGKSTPILTMDATETEVTSVLGPGQASGAAISKAELQTVFLAVGDTLLLASDGLVRGHRDGLAKELQSVCPSKVANLNSAPSTAAMDILRLAAQHGDQAFNLDPEQKLFADNLSLIAMTVDRT